MIYCQRNLVQNSIVFELGCRAFHRAQDRRPPRLIHGAARKAPVEGRQSHQVEETFQKSKPKYTYSAPFLKNFFDFKFFLNCEYCFCVQIGQDVAGAEKRRSRGGKEEE